MVFLFFVVFLKRIFALRVAFYAQNLRVLCQKQSKTTINPLIFSV